MPELLTAWLLTYLLHSTLLLSGPALNSIMPNDLRLALESEILLVAAEVVQGIAPAAGQALPGDDVVTPN